MVQTDNEKPLVSIICITYNHVKYIKDALDSFLMQKTDFKYEILINDDASTDGTTDILKLYEEKYPDIIRVVYHEKNQYSAGKKNHFAITNLFEIAQGDYYAFCEGDDFWNDEKKLQIQIDFLRLKKDYSAIYHNVNVVDQNGEKVRHPVFSDSLLAHECEMDTITIKGTINCHVSSLVCKSFWNDLTEEAKEEFKYNYANGDMLLYVLNLLNGKVYYLDSIMSTYRHITSNAGSWSAATKNKNLWDLRYRMYEALDTFSYVYVKKNLDFSLVYNNIYARAYLQKLYKGNDENKRIFAEIRSKKRLNRKILFLIVKYLYIDFIVLLKCIVKKVIKRSSDQSTK